MHSTTLQTVSNPSRRAQPKQPQRPPILPAAAGRVGHSASGMILLPIGHSSEGRMAGGPPPRIPILQDGHHLPAHDSTQAFVFELHLILRGCPIPSLSEGVGGFDFHLGSSRVPDFNPQNQPRSRHRAVVGRKHNYSIASPSDGPPDRVSPDSCACS